ncbi:lipid IV(A) 3-deoxy-D-manno-octulosonic acid transferase [Gallibacterium genomosp. 1]|uniref:3-deoxy-D-manno-octulosonic acid transferase n=1 Tax=Gallibacterium genomosp. 1 TaxID=155515 RepID=A0A0A2XYI3_9PAST|nr:lipid IV(A) 3-deoxy-D-manno-octulosonic acid transferase [Gallibacterium genomosp. 1]KGQ37436.1 3-deoxy-D-manno-octulosonic acid transferase [Gallibacterium genomosp. 1]
MLFFIYNVLFIIALPFILLTFLYKSRKEIGYRQRWRERFALTKSLQKQSVVIHAASVGEVLLVTPLVKQLLAQFPNVPITITTFTPGGSERVQALFSNRVQHCYLPFDLPFLMKRFLQQFQPQCFIIVETELWFNLLQQIKNHHIPLFLINARLSDKSAKHYAYLRHSLMPIWQAFTHISAQDELSVERYQRLGVDKSKISCSGNLKFDLTVSDEEIADYRQQKIAMLQQRPVWIAASTHEGEETMVLKAHQQLLQRYPNLLLILVPRHSARFTEVEKLLRQQQFCYQKRSLGELIVSQTTVLLGDTMGELLKLYALADIAFIGGSFIERGGHNPLEPLLFKLPVISGKHMFNFQQIYQKLIEAEGVIVIENSIPALVQQISALLTNPQKAEQYGQNGYHILQQNRGALQRTLNILLPYLSEKK